jgi:hypothetical protein
MTDVGAVQSAAQNLADRDEDALELLLGLQQQAIDKDPELASDPNLSPQYEPHMGLLDTVKSLGRSIAFRWAESLHGLVCESKSVDQQDRNKILDALNLGETAVIGAVAAALMGLAVPAPIAAAAAALIVKRFIWPARDELCTAWGEALQAGGAA